MILRGGWGNEGIGQESEFRANFNLIILVFIESFGKTLTTKLIKK